MDPDQGREQEGGGGVGGGNKRIGAVDDTEEKDAT